MSQGPILDRTTEQLCSSDKELVRVRQHLLKSVHAFRQGERLPTADVTELDYGKIYSVAGILDAGTDWHTLVEAAEKRYVKQPPAGGVAAG
jgi:hypothetical protein